MKKSDKKVTVVCITYNQENFIARALESFAEQKTDFPFEVIVSDDCSTDKTPEIIKEYAKKYSEIIKPIFRQKNLGVLENFVQTLSAVKSEYVVYNEGDDCFCNPNKLQKQVDFLDKNPDFSICFHPVKVIFENSPSLKSTFPLPRQRFNKTVLGLDELLNHNFIQTNSCMYRWRFRKEKLENVFPKDIMPCDWYLHLLHARKGKIGFIEDKMAVYRRHERGIWGSFKNGDVIHLKYGFSELNFFKNVYENITNKSEDYLENHLIPNSKHIFSIFCKNGKWKEIEELFKKYPDFCDTIIDSQSERNICGRLRQEVKIYKRLAKIFAASITLLLILTIALLIFAFCV